jgi:pimeloyl-ACP methyl ester carboxylesterase
MRSLRSAVIFTLIVINLSFTMAETGHQSSIISRPTIVLKPCTLPGVIGEAQCGILDVYENRREMRGRRIYLKVVVLPALKPKPSPQALFILAGGPGQAASKEAAFMARTFAQVRRERDIVLVDQRGTGESNGLRCDLYGNSLQDHLGDLIPLKAVESCLDKWEPNSDLSFYTTPLAMDDLEDVRAALNYEKIDIFGTSYGTRAAQVYLRQYPDRVRSMILKGVTPISETIPPFIARHAQQSLDLVFDDCLKNDACRRAFPKLKHEFSELLARFANGGVRIDIPPEKTGKTERVILSRGAFVTTLHSMLQSPTTIAQLPLFIHEAFQGDYSFCVRTALSIRRQFCENVSTGAFLAVFNEDLRLIDLEQAGRESAGTFMGDYYYRQLHKACGFIPHAILSSGYREPIISEVPVLLVSGFLDPATPPENGEIVAKNLPNSRHLVVRYGSHFDTGLMPCLDKVMNDFIARGEINGLDTSCIDRMPNFSFQTQPNQKRNESATIEK